MNHLATAVGGYGASLLNALIARREHRVAFVRWRKMRSFGSFGKLAPELTTGIPT
jgi:hypothetical protein